MDIAYYQQQTYPQPPCWALVTLVYARELSRQVSAYKAANGGLRAIAEAFRLALHRGHAGMTRVIVPDDLSVVLMGKNGRIGYHHVGVHYRGYVLHALSSGVYYQDMASIRDAYPAIEFWSPSC